MKFSRSLLLVLVAASFVLGGCSVFDEVGSWFASSGKKSNLRGVRIPVMSAESELKVDPTMANTPVVLPPPYRNPDWPEPGGYASNAMYHLAAPGRLRQIWDQDAGKGSDSDSLLTSPAGRRRRADLCAGFGSPYLGLSRQRRPSRLEQAAGAQERHRHAHALGPVGQAQYGGSAARHGRRRRL